MTAILLLTGITNVTASPARERTLSGTVTDIVTGEPLIGAAILIDGSTKGTITDVNGAYGLSLPQGDHSINVSYIGYISVDFSVRVAEKVLLSSQTEGVAQAGEYIYIYLAPDNEALAYAVITARKNMESLTALQNERITSGFAIENLGAKEMSLKGISNAQEGVVKMTGISVADAGQLIVRGLGDRYSTTTLNGLPIASPNPDNKLIPLDIFPSSTIQNITVSKVYEVSSFADYSGAHVDISTKVGDGKDFFSVSFSTGGYFGTIFQDAFHMDGVNLFSSHSLDGIAESIAYADFADYSVSKDIFGSGFQTHKKTALPDLNGGFGFGKNFFFSSGNTLSILASTTMKSGNQTICDAYARTYEASSSAGLISDYNYDSYKSFLDMAGLFNAEYSFRGTDRIALTAFYARNAESSYLMRWGEDVFEDYTLLGNNQVTHIYALQDYQLSGKHVFGRMKLDWGLSYSLTSSDEPDRRQVMFRQNTSGDYVFFSLNQQETQRYYGSLDEDELSAGIKARYEFNEDNSIRIGATVKDKSRDYKNTRFYYNVRGLSSYTIGDNISWLTGNMDKVNVDQYLNYDSVSAGTVSIDRKQHSRDRYDAGLTVYSGFIETDLRFGQRWSLNAGVRAESSSQFVNYNDDVEDLTRDLDSFDLFPAVNLKYSFSERKMLRLSLSRTVTRPSFVEMAPFLYQESFGGAQVRGNAELENGYNYNADLRFEIFSQTNTDMFAVTAYFKYLDTPIERTQQISGGATVHSFQNADSGVAAGLEAEFRVGLVKDVTLNANASYIYTDVTLPEGGSYTNSHRALQGASPYLVNADLAWTPGDLSLALLYNIQGPRIQSVGVLGLGDVKQLPFHSLDLSGSYEINSHFSLSFSLKNILDSTAKYRQDVPNSDTTVDIEAWRTGLGFGLGITWKL